MMVLADFASHLASSGNPFATSEFQAAAGGKLDRVIMGSFVAVLGGTWL